MYEIDLNLPKQIVADVLSNHEIHSVAFVGCGASMSDLYPAKYFLANNTDKLNVQIFTANEFNYNRIDVVGLQLLDNVIHLAVARVRTVFLKGQAQNYDLGSFRSLTCLNHLLNSSIRYICTHAVVYNSTIQDNLAVIT